MSFTRSTLIDFQTVLAPLVKTSNVQFYKKPNSGSRLGSAINAPFTRAGAGRKVIDASGNLVDAAANVPAWTFPIGGSSAGCPYLSFLPSVENIFTYSEAFDNADWTKDASSISANATTAPDGNTTADKLIEDSSAAQHRVRQTISPSTSTDYTLFVFAEKAERTAIKVSVGGAGMTGAGGSGADLDAIFDLETGSVRNDAYNARIENIINDIYLCAITFTTDSDGGSIVPYFALVESGTTTTYTGDGTSGLFIWGAQLKQGSYISPLDYVKTEASAVTRSADDLTDITDLQGSGYLTSATEGSIIFNFKYNGSNGSILIGPQFENSSNVDQFAFVTRVAGLGFFDYVNSSYAWLDDNLNTEGELQRLIACWDSSGLQVYLNGFLIYSATGSFSVSRIRDFDSNSIELGFKMLNFAPTALTASQAEAASSWPSFDLMVSDLGYS